MRIKLHPSVAKQVEANRGVLPVHAEVNRALDEYYAMKKAQRKTLSKDAK